MGNREISAVELAQALMAQAEKCQEVNALVDFDAERFLQAAGIADEKPFCIKIDKRIHLLTFFSLSHECLSQFYR
jgi:hypothetical protein